MRRSTNGPGIPGAPRQWDDAGFPSSGKLARLELVEHFTSAGDGLVGLIQSVSGTGSALSGGVVAPASGQLGIGALSTGTDTTGRAAFVTNGGALLFGGGRWRIRCDVAVPTASDGTDTFTVRFGFQDSASGDGADGVFFRYVHSANSGNWVCVTRSASTETTTNTSEALDDGTYKAFEIEVNAAGTQALFYIDGEVVATHTENIPTGSGRETGYGISIVKSAGTTSRSAHIDLLAVSFEPSAPA